MKLFGHPQTDLLETFFYRKLIIDKFEVNSPIINVASFTDARLEKKDRRAFNFSDFYQIIQGHVDYMQVNELALNRAILRYVNHNAKGRVIDFDNQFSMKLERFLLDEQAAKQTDKLPAESFSLSIENHTFHLPDGVHNIHVDALNFSSKDSCLQAYNTKLYADKKSPNHPHVPWLYFIDAPVIRIGGVDLEALSFEKLILLGDFELSHARIELHENFKSRRVRREKDGNYSPLNFKMPKGIDALQMTSLRLENCKLTMINRKESDFHTILSTMANADFRQIAIAKDEHERASFKVGKYDFHLNKYQQLLPHEEQQIIFHDFQISSETKTFELHKFELKTRNKSGEYHSFIQMPKLLISDIDVRTLIDNKRFACAEIHALKPVVDMNFLPQQKKSKQDKATNIYQVKIPQGLEDVFSFFDSNSLVIQDAELRFRDDFPLAKAQGIDLRINGLHIDSEPSKRLFGADSFALSAKDIHFENELYRFALNRIAFSSATQLLSAQGLELMPLHDFDSFQQYFDFQTECFVVRLPALELQGFDVEQLLNQQCIRAQKLKLDNLGLFAYRDRRLPFNDANRPPMPQEFLRHIPIAMDIDSLQLIDATFVYSERLNLTPELYKVCFNETQALLHPFSNQRFSNPMQLEAQSKLQASGDLNVHMTFDMLSDSCNYSVSAELSPLDLTSISAITDNAALVAIKSGTLNSLRMDFDADKYCSRGNLVLDYESLGVTALKYEDGKLKKRKLISFIANLAVPNKIEQTRKQEESSIYFERDDSKSIFSYWWKSVFSGLKDAFGVADKAP